ncbi:MAG TPA: PIN domain-containing protein [Longimicrobiales bacterium]|nr:PIN domain-containing protein [Longimicrobiales bacterium]
MIAYVDSTVVLRLVLNQPGRLEAWEEIDVAIRSALVEVECLRTLDRLRLRDDVGDRQLAERRESLHRLIAGMEIVEPSRPVLARASQPFPTSLGTLDAIHLSTALLWREETGESLTLATHDAALALGGRAFGLPVIGV